MKTIKWYADFGLVGADREGEVEVEEGATDEEIEAAVREDVLNFLEWNWVKVEK